MRKYIITWGSSIGAAFIAYFLLMVAIGLIHVVELRMLNFLILLTGVYLAVRETHREPNKEFSYFDGFISGYGAGALGIMIFLVFFVIYIHVLNPDFITSIRDKVMFSQYVNKTSSVGILFMEGYGSCFLATFIVMQYMKAKSTRINA